MNYKVKSYIKSINFILYFFLIISLVIFIIFFFSSLLYSKKVYILMDFESKCLIFLYIYTEQLECVHDWYYLYNFKIIYYKSLSTKEKDSQWLMRE